MIPGALPQAYVELRAFGAKHVQKRSADRSPTCVLTFIPRTSTMTFMHRRLLISVILASAFLVAAAAQEGPKDAVVLIIRHAEDADSGDGISPRGQERAQAYKNYFLNFTVDSKRREPQVIFAAKDSKKSHRPRLTMEPFAKAANLKIDTRFGNGQSADLAADLRANQQGKVILICWRHPYIPALLGALGANPETFLPNGKWPGAVFDWIILLSFDQDGLLIPSISRRSNEHLLPGDSE
jgi:hypothetical protein